MKQRRLWLCMTLMCLLAVFTADLVGHLSVVKTLPASDAEISTPPERIQVWFNQQPSPRISRLDVQGPDGEVALEQVVVEPQDHSISAAVPAPLAPGIYQVTWRTAADDGHVMRGTFKFTVTRAE